MFDVLKRYLFAEPSRIFTTRPLCLMVSGVSGVGKSTLAECLSHRLNAHLVSTDHLREALRTAYPEEFYPELHTHTYTVRSKASDGKWRPRGVLQGLLAQAELLEKPLEALGNRVLRERRSLILEGVHLLPGSPLCLAFPLCLNLLLVVRSPEEHLRRLQLRVRTADSDASAALNHFSQLRAQQQALERRAKAHQVPIIASDKLDAEQAVLALLRQQSLGFHPLASSFGSKPQPSHVER